MENHSKNHHHRRSGAPQATRKSSRHPPKAPPTRLRERAQAVHVTKATRDLREALLRRECLPTRGRHDDTLRQSALALLEMILAEWVSTTKSRVSKWERPRASLVTFGSYRLGVHRLESDLDVLAVMPPTCSRDEFFSGLVDRLKTDSRISNVHAIPTAFTPVVKLRIHNIDIDMLFANAASTAKLLEFQRKSPPPVVSQSLKAMAAVEPVGGSSSQRREYTVDDADLVGADAPGVRSLNGVRVTQMILKAVEGNEDVFRVTLCAVKEWAIINGLYSNALGFLGGINLAILVAWMCQRHPEQKASSLLRMFFRTFGMWEWPKPVALGPVQKDPPPNGVPSIPVWDPQANPWDARQIMPIITPAYPAMNSAYNVGISQLRRLQEEMISAARKMERGKGQWHEVLEDTDFFYRHRNFVQVSITASNADDFLLWHRFCESKLRLLILSLETPQVMVWPFAHFFQRRYTRFGLVQDKRKVSDDSCKHESFFYMALRYAPGIGSLDLRYQISDFAYKMNSWEERKEGMDLSICSLDQSELPAFVFARPQVHEVHSWIRDPCAPVTTTAVPASNALLEVNGEPGTKLTPKLARSTLADEDVDPNVRAKKAKKGCNGAKESMALTNTCTS